jgi:hypothetical protein
MAVLRVFPRVDLLVGSWDLTMVAQKAVQMAWQKVAWWAVSVVMAV